MDEAKETVSPEARAQTSELDCLYAVGSRLGERGWRVTYNSPECDLLRLEWRSPACGMPYELTLDMRGADPCDPEAWSRAARGGSLRGRVIAALCRPFDSDRGLVYARELRELPGQVDEALSAIDIGQRGEAHVRAMMQLRFPCDDVWTSFDPGVTFDDARRAAASADPDELRYELGGPGGRVPRVGMSRFAELRRELFGSDGPGPDPASGCLDARPPDAFERRVSAARPDAAASGAARAMRP